MRLVIRTLLAEEGVRRAVLLDDELAGAEAALAGNPGHQAQVLLGQAREEIHAAQNSGRRLAACHVSSIIVGTRGTVSSPAPRPACAGLERQQSDPQGRKPGGRSAQLVIELSHHGQT
jgi:hypothetical protein